MNRLLIVTKLSVPTPPARAVDRPQLYRRIQHALQSGQRLVLVSAPAGFGKSSLISDWIRHDPHVPVAWLSLDADDNYPEMFLQYLLAAITKALPTATVPAFFASWTELTDSTLRLLLAPLVNELARQALPFVIVLDDYHEISNPLVHNILTFLLKYLPTCVQLVIASRTDPPLPLSSLRARQQLAEIRLADLRFNPQEIRSFFVERWSVPLAEDVLQTIVARTEGWPVGLQLAALVLADLSPEDAHALLTAFNDTNSFILEYLAEEVFQHLPAPTQQFLLRTSILDRLNDELCQALLDDVAAAPTLNAVLRRNLFLIQLGEQRWYRYHHLFAQFLRAHLSQTFAPQQIAALHIRASTWFLQHGFRREAIDYAVRAEAWSDVLRLLTPAPPLHEIFSNLHIWRRWIGMLPDAVIITSPVLYLVKMWGEMFGGDIALVEQGLERSDIAFSDTERGNLHLLQSQIAFFRGHHERRVYELTRSLELLSPEEEPFLWVLAAILFNMTQMQHNPTPTPSPLQARAWQIAVTLNNPILMTMAATNLSDNAFLSGKLHQATSWLNEVRTLITNSYLLGAAYWCRLVAQIAYERNDLVQAEQAITQGIEITHSVGPRQHLPHFHMMLARTYAALGSRDDASIQTLLTQAQADIVAHQNGRWREIAESQAYELRRMLAQDDLVRARQWGAANALDLHEPLTRDVHWLIVAHVDLARAILRHAGDPGPAAAVEQVLTNALAMSAAEGHWNDHIQLLTLHALLLWDLGRADEAAASLSQALALGEPEGYLRTFLDEGPALLPLLAHPTVAQAAPVLVPQLRALLAPPSTWGPEPNAAPELLSVREHEILRLVAAGCSVQDLAAQLVISVHTARTHLKNIYTKLDVHTRLQAVEQARKRGILLAFLCLTALSWRFLVNTLTLYS